MHCVAAKSKMQTLTRCSRHEVGQRSDNPAPQGITLGRWPNLSASVRAACNGPDGYLPVERRLGLTGGGVTE